MSANANSILQAFVEALPAELDALRASAEAATGGAVLPLDHSYESLDRLEDYYRQLVERTDAPELAKQARDPIAYYVGATVIARVGGVWKIAGNPPKEPVVTKVPKVKGGELDPVILVLDFKRGRIPGSLRNSVELWDIALRKSVLAESLANLDHELAALRAEVAELVDSVPDVLDGSEPSLAALEHALRHLIDSSASRETRRRVRGRAVLLLGTLFRNAVGGDWTVCDEGINADLGLFRVRDWAPHVAVRSVAATSPPGRLQARLSTAIAGAQRK